MSGKSKFRFLLTGSLLLLFFVQFILAQSAGSVQEMHVSTDGSPMTKNEILSRVMNARAKSIDVDDIAADVDRRGIDFEMETHFADQIRFMRAAVVANALWRADDRRKALVAKPKNVETIEEVQGHSKRDLSSLPFIEQARAVALAYVASLPNFIVSEEVQRYGRPTSGNWKLGDYLELAVSYAANRGEEVKLKLQNGKSSLLTLDQVSGLTSTGQFAGQLAMLFDPDSRTEFVEQGKVNFYGQPCLLYTYRVATKNSRYQLRVEKAQIITGCRGQIYIQQDTKQVLRMELEAIEIPYDFPITEATSVVDFGWVTISNKDFLLPVSAQVSLTSKQDHFTALNCITFHKYGKFETDVKIVD